MAETTHSFPHRGQHLQFLFEQRIEIHRNQYCEEFSAVGKRLWQSSALASPTETLNTFLALNQLKRPVQMSKWEAVKTNNHWKQLFPEQEQNRRTHKSRKTRTGRFRTRCAEVGVLLVSKVEELVDNIELDCWKKRNEKGRLRS